ncbi:MAG: hypothetical protein HY518_04320 [Candidatus Aenigmarchaeota archaeon]|nr:hypothetical protein [Candidatus Aenigmarchaeota archaeon]
MDESIKELDGGEDLYCAVIRNGYLNDMHIYLTDFQTFRIRRPKGLNMLSRAANLIPEFGLIQPVPVRT